MKNYKKFRDDITFLRAISVLMVVIFHFHFSHSKGGFIGVDVFFVISGFLMTQIIENGLREGKFKYSQFLISRIKRIWPAMGVMLISLLLVAIFFMSPLDTNIIANQVLYAAGFISNHFYLSTSGYFTADNDSRWLLHTWSLSVEWQFYMIYPFILMASRKLVNKIAGHESEARVEKLHILILASLGAVSLWICIYFSTKNPSIAFFILPTRAWEMIAGGLAFFAFRHLQLSDIQRQIISILGITVIAGSFFVIGRLELEKLWPSYYALFPVIGAVMVLSSAFGNSRIFNNKAVQSIGLWSYSIYLWHWPLVVLFGITHFEENYHLASKIIGFLLSVTLGYLSYRFVETSSLKSTKSQILALRKPLSVMAGAAFIAVALISLGGLNFKVSGNPYYASLINLPKVKEIPSACGNIRTPAADLKTCTINKGTQAKVLIIGDSHAGHLYPWFYEKSPLTTDYLISNGCPPLPGFNSTSVGFYCNDFADSAWKKAFSGDYKIVFVSMNWRAFNSSSHGMCRVVGDRCVSKESDPENNPRTILERLISKANDKKIKLVILGPTPFFDHSVPEYLYREAYWSNEILLTLRANNFVKGNEELVQIFESASKKFHPHIFYEPLANLICTEDICQTYDSELDMPIFKDTDHFNPNWIVEKGDVLMKYFDDSSN
ncbi:acyltransferase [Methylovorus menthalis]|uniref:acyltransferase family protein n=1 Tax=Methylovorus menthalis TaxID=1002227 RepID=UPI001E3790D6|nr:acyltransferase family protein [Methylovorus menthalis]MCB4811811.1 acyltransferase [Methylovorus menthalis]